MHHDPQQVTRGNKFHSWMFRGDADPGDQSPARPTLVVHGHVGGVLHHSRPAVNHVDPALVLQLLSPSLQRLDEVLVRVGADHPSLQDGDRSANRYSNTSGNSPHMHGYRKKQRLRPRIQLTAEDSQLVYLEQVRLSDKEEMTSN